MAALGAWAGLKPVINTPQPTFAHYLAPTRISLRIASADSPPRSSRTGQKGKPIVFSTIVPRKNILFYEDGREEAECVIFEHGEVSRFELDSLEEKECVRDSASSILEEASLHARGRNVPAVSDTLAV